MPWRELLEDGDRLQSVSLALVGAAREKQQPRERAQRIALSEAIAPAAMPLERLLLGRDRLIELGTEPALLDAALLQVVAVGGSQIVGMTQRARGIVGRRLAVSAGDGGALRGTGRPFEHAADVAGGLGMVCEPREIGVVADTRGQCIDRGTVEREPAVRRDRVLDRQPRFLVRERCLRVFRPLGLALTRSLGRVSLAAMLIALLVAGSALGKRSARRHHAPRHHRIASARRTSTPPRTALNVALTGTATATTEPTGSPAANAIDGNASRPSGREA